MTRLFAHTLKTSVNRLGRRWTTGLLFLLLLSGCGFQLKGTQRPAFDSIALQPESGSALVSALRQALTGSVVVMQGPKIGRAHV